MFLSQGYERALMSCRLFDGFSPGEARAVLEDFAARTKEYHTNEVAVFEGEEQREFGIVLKGALRAQKLMEDGREYVMSEINEGGVFAEILAGSNAESPVTVRASKPSAAALITYSSVFAAGGDAGVRFLKNYIRLISDKYFEQNRRVDMLLAGTIRERVLMYLSQYAGENSGIFSVPHDRESQARLLGCERSALSRELAGMKRDGLIDYRKNEFKLLGAR